MHKLEIPCRILLIIHVLISLLGYVAFLQADRQLVSPLIPATTVVEIARQSITSSLISGVLLIPSLLFYFYHKHLFLVICSTAAIVIYVMLFNSLIIL
ncbi:MAG TPA: hypothetical protein PLZ45_09195 [Ferruginibacter sp.]|nr:hypothetical protein [Ferruginibacter sp.]